MASVKYVATLYFESCLISGIVYFFNLWKIYPYKFIFIVECRIQEVRMEVIQKCSVQNMH